MKLCYVILTCEPYLKTRCVWMRNSWLRYIEPDDDYRFLSSIPNPSQKVLGWNTPDTYEGCAQKYVCLVKHAELPPADWYVFVDDDTFVFPTRLRRRLRAYSPDNRIFLGKFIGGPIPTMSGGAGFAASRRLFQEIQHYAKTHEFEPSTHYSDVTFAEFVQKIPNVSYVHDNTFSSHPHTEEGNVNTSSTFHYTTEDLFKYYSRFLYIRMPVQLPFNISSTRRSIIGL
jgi:hypothetical protein